jgi:Cu/Ag efflux protein CusF
MGRMTKNEELVTFKVRLTGKNVKKLDLSGRKINLSHDTAIFA